MTNENGEEIKNSFSLEPLRNLAYSLLPIEVIPVLFVHTVERAGKNLIFYYRESLDHSVEFSGIQYLAHHDWDGLKEFFSAVKLVEVTEQIFHVTGIEYVLGMNDPGQNEILVIYRTEEDCPHAEQLAKSADSIGVKVRYEFHDI